MPCATSTIRVGGTLRTTWITVAVWKFRSPAQEGVSTVIFGALADLQQGRFGGPSILSRCLGYNFVDAGHDWLIFALPPAELAVHPAVEGGRTGLG